MGKQHLYRVILKRFLELQAHQYFSHISFRECSFTDGTLIIGREKFFSAMATEEMMAGSAEAPSPEWAPTQITTQFIFITFNFSGFHVSLFK
jgi:hypothetical protein